jgi:hypothetical protein
MEEAKGVGQGCIRKNGILVLIDIWPRHSDRLLSLVSMPMFNVSVVIRADGIPCTLAQPFHVSHASICCADDVGVLRLCER